MNLNTICCLKNKYIWISITESVGTRPTICGREKYNSLIKLPKPSDRKYMSMKELIYCKRKLFEDVRVFTSNFCCYSFWDAIKELGIDLREFKIQFRISKTSGFYAHYDLLTKEDTYVSV